LEVFKFGGASIKDADGIKNVVKIIGLHPDKSLVIVVSAMGKITNVLEKLTDAFVQKADNAVEVFERIKDFHHQILIDLFDEPHPEYDFNYDQIVSIGELVSSKILSSYLNFSGLSNTWLDARGCIHTDNTYREGKVDWVKTRQNIQKSVDCNTPNYLTVTQGFIGGTSENFTTTLGREGSDYTAAIFASCLDCPSVTIWKDVPGVLNADPKWFEKTEKIDQLSYQDAIELTYYGATVIHPKTIKPLQNKNIKLFVRSFLNPEEPGTVISNLENNAPVASFIFKMNQVLISIFPKDFSFIVEENLSHIFQLFHNHHIKINTMQNSAMSFSVCVDQNEQKLQTLISDLKEEFKVKYNGNLEMVTIRWYDQNTIDRVTENKHILLEVKSRHTCQIVMKGTN
jgi:aspartate kinase